jgi:DNA transformation protein
MPVSASFVDYVREQLAGLGGVSSRRMFGGVGLYRSGQFFGLIDDDALYFKVDGRNRGAYEARGMAPFRPYRDRPEVSMSYFQVPVDVIEDAELLTQWARASVGAALDSAQTNPSARRKRAPRRG